jgi:hypothetical protein
MQIFGKLNFVQVIKSEEGGRVGGGGHMFLVRQRHGKLHSVGTLAEGEGLVHLTSSLFCLKCGKYFLSTKSS